MPPWMIFYAVLALFTLISFIWFAVSSIKATIKHEKQSKVPLIVFLAAVVLMIAFWGKFRSETSDWIGNMIHVDVKSDPVPDRIN